MIELAALLGGAFLGGLLLNISPCVLSVLGLKIVNFIRAGQGSWKAGVLYGLIYGLGILSSFLILALIAICIEISGGYALFGIHLLGSKVIGTTLGAVTALLGLHYLGVLGRVRVGCRYCCKRLLSLIHKIWLFRVHNPSVMHKNTAISTHIYPIVGRFTLLQTYLGTFLYEYKKKAPYIGTYLQGCLTTYLGSACCAPILVWAMGIALAGSPPIILAAFLCAGLGMAAPYILLPMFPIPLPKNGRWVRWTEGVAGALLLLTGAWLILI